MAYFDFISILISPIIKDTVMVKIMHTLMANMYNGDMKCKYCSTMNISKAVKDRANITIAIECEVEYGLSISIIFTFISGVF